MSRVGVSLLTCNLAEQPMHLRAAQYAVRSLLDSDLQNSDWRIQVVDNGSTCPETRRWLEQLARDEERVAVHWAGANLGIGAGRNLSYGLLQAAHAPEYFVEVHTDHVFPAEWLGASLALFAGGRYERLGIVGSALLTHHAHFPWRIARADVSYRMPYGQVRGRVDAVAKAVRRPAVRPGLSHPCVQPLALWEDIGFRRDGYLLPYDPDMPGKQNFEDTEEAYRAHKAGWQVVINLGSVVCHHYHFSRTHHGIANHHQEYAVNQKYLAQKYGPEFGAVWEFVTATVGGWLDRAYRM